LDLWSHMSDFARGIVDTRRLVYYLSASLFFLFAAAKTLEAKKWK
jgi:ABC-2 type transport system permease protein